LLAGGLPDWGLRHFFWFCPPEKAGAGPGRTTGPLPVQQAEKNNRGSVFCYLFIDSFFPQPTTHHPSFTEGYRVTDKSPLPYTPNTKK